MYLLIAVGLDSKGTKSRWDASDREVIGLWVVGRCRGGGGEAVGCGVVVGGGWFDVGSGLASSIVRIRDKFSSLKTATPAPGHDRTPTTLPLLFCSF
jgi:hypothetical protein